jgi:hypothetical protein
MNSVKASDERGMNRGSAGAEAGRGKPDLSSGRISGNRVNAPLHPFD